MKAVEFMKLTQGKKTLTEYMHAFNNLSRYAPAFMDTKEKKIESFKRGFGTNLIKPWPTLDVLHIMNLSAMPSHKRTRTTYMWQQKAASEPLR